MQTKQKVWTLKKKTQQYLISNELKSNGRIIKGAILSVLAGFIVAGIIIAIQNVNPFEYYAKLFSIAFNPLYVSQTLQWFSVYIVAGLAMAVGFKTGLFNIGVSGQMLAGASMGTVIFNLVTPGAQKVEGWMVFVIFIMCVGTGTLLAALAGWLKAMFNIHEVVTTIMLNWFIWYLFKFVFSKWKADFAPSGLATNPFPQGTLDWGTSEVAGPIIIALVVVFIVWIIFSKTVFGFRLKAVGSSASVSKYAGINVRNKIIAAMAISGALAGLASFINIFTVSPNISFGADNLPTVGYDAIAVALVAFNNPFGVIGVSALWGMVQSAGGSAAALFNIPSQMSLLIFGIVVYFAAISIVFIKWAPSYNIKLRYYIRNSKLYSSKSKELNKKALQYRWWIHEPNRNPDYQETMLKFKEQIKNAQDNEQINQIKTEMKNYKFNFKENCRLNLSKYETQLKNYKTNVYTKEIERGLKGIKTRSQQRINKINERGLTEVNLLNLELVKAESYFAERVDKIVHTQDHQLKALKIQFKKDKDALKVWKEGQLGELNLDFELHSQKIALKGEYSKQKNIFEEEIKNLRSEQRLQFHLIKFNDELNSSEKKLRRQNVKKDTQEKIAIIKNSQLQNCKISYQENLADLKEKHHLRALELKENPEKIQALDAEYQSRLTNLTNQYSQDIEAVKNDELIRISKFDLNKAQTKLDQAAVILDQGLIKLNLYKVNSQMAAKVQISNLNQQLLLINETVGDIYMLFGRHQFQEYDSDKIVKQKVKILVQLAKLEHLCNVQLVIVKTNEALAKAEKQNQKILSNYKKNLVTFKQEYKTSLQDIKSKPKDENYQKSLIENEEVYNNKINNYIGSLENEYLIKGVN